MLQRTLQVLPALQDLECRAAHANVVIKVLKGNGFPRGKSVLWPPCKLSLQELSCNNNNKTYVRNALFLYLKISHISFDLHSNPPQRRGSRWREKLGDLARAISLEEGNVHLHPSLPRPSPVRFPSYYTANENDSGFQLGAIFPCSFPRDIC